MVIACTLNFSSSIINIFKVEVLSVMEKICYVEKLNFGSRFQERIFFNYFYLRLLNWQNWDSWTFQEKYFKLMLKLIS